MRNELLKTYRIAIETKDKDVIKLFKRKQQQIGPIIVIDECLKVDRQQETINELVVALETIRDFIEGDVLGFATQKIDSALKEAGV